MQRRGSLVPTRDELLVVLGSAVVGTLLVVKVASWIASWHDEVIAALEARLVADQTVPVLVAAMVPGEVIEPGDLTNRRLPSWAIPDGTIRDPEQVLGRTVVERVLPGEVIREERLAPAGADPGLEAVIPTGLRALTLNLVDDDRVSGFVEPGDYVDVLTTIAGDDGYPTETLTLVDAVRVLTVDTRILVTPAGAEVHRPSVTLAITPAEAERVAAAVHASMGLKLTLRSELDWEPVERSPVVTADLLRGPRLTVAEYREQVSDQDLERMVHMVAGASVTREPVIDIDAILHPRM